MYNNLTQGLGTLELIALAIIIFIRSLISLPGDRVNFLCTETLISG